MSNTTAKEKWIIKDSNGKRHGQPTYESREAAARDVPALTESSGGQNLTVVQLLQE